MIQLQEEKVKLISELGQISDKLIDVQYQLVAEKRKPVPIVPVLYPEETKKDPFQVYRRI